MRNGYKIYWTPNALNELEETISYLKNNFTDREVRKLASKIEKVVYLIAQNPEIFPKSKMNDVCRVVILKFNTMYYRIKEQQIEIVSFFSNRKNPDKHDIKN